MSSREVRIIDNQNIDLCVPPGSASYTVVTGENVVIGHADSLREWARPSAMALADLFFNWRRACPSLSDSAIVADLIRRGHIPAPTPDDN